MAVLDVYFQGLFVYLFIYLFIFFFFETRPTYSRQKSGLPAFVENPAYDLDLQSSLAKVKANQYTKKSQLDGCTEKTGQGDKSNPSYLQCTQNSSDSPDHVQQIFEMSGQRAAVKFNQMSGKKPQIRVRQSPNIVREFCAHRVH